MAKKIVQAFLMILITMGIMMTISNFMIKPAYASAIWGTEEVVTSLFWQLVYYLQGRWLYDNVYCIHEPSTCTIVN